MWAWGVPKPHPTPWMLPAGRLRPKAAPLQHCTGLHAGPWMWRTWRPGDLEELVGRRGGECVCRCYRCVHVCMHMHVHVCMTGHRTHDVTDHHGVPKSPPLTRATPRGGLEMGRVPTRERRGFLDHSARDITQQDLNQHMEQQSQPDPGAKPNCSSTHCS